MNGAEMDCISSFSALDDDIFSKLPPVKTGGIVAFRLRLPDFVGYFHPPVLLVVLKSEE